MPAEIWKDREVAKAFLDERSLLIPDRPRQLEVILRVVGFHCPQPRRILDLGSGDAILLTTLMESFPLTLSNCRFVVSEAHQRGGRHQVVEPMFMVAFAVESMNGTVVGAGLVAPRGIGAKVQQ